MLQECFILNFNSFLACALCEHHTIHFVSASSCIQSLPSVKAGKFIMEWQPDVHPAENVSTQVTNVGHKQILWSEKGKKCLLNTKAANKERYNVTQSGRVL